MFFDWIRRLFLRPSRSQRRRYPSSVRKQRKRSVHLRPELLEDRITPTTFNATDAADLQSDFAYANSNPTQQVIINLSSSDTYNLGAIGTQLTDQSTAGILLNGNGATLTAATNNRIFEVDNTDILSLNNLTLTGGGLTAATAQGGALADFGGYVTLSAVNVTGNAVHGSKSAQGGGIYVSGSASLTIENGCSINNNEAIGSANGGGANASGGGIYVSGGGTVNLTSSTLSNNKALGGNATGHTKTSFGAAGNNGGSAQGGGLYVNGSGWNVTLSGSTLANNSAQGGAGATGSMSGAGGSGGSAQGGGLYVNNGTTSFTILSTSFSGNTAQGGNGGQGGYGLSSGGNGGSAEGGALTDLSINSLSIQQSSFDNNRVNGGSGGAGGTGRTVTLSGTTYFGSSGGSGGNGGTAGGGGLYAWSQALILNSSFTNNTLTGGGGGSGGNGGTGGTMLWGGNGGNGGNGGGAGGGGVLAVGFGGVSPTVINTTVAANTVQGAAAGAGGVGGSGGAAYGSNGMAGNAGSAAGGGVHCTGASLINDTVAFNSAVAGSGGQTAAIAKGGGIESWATLTNVILEDNTSTTTAPDMDGSLGSSSSYDFISNTSGIYGTIPTTGMILNNSTSQLGSLTVDPIFGLSYYPVLSGSLCIGTGTTSEVNTIAGAEGVPVADAADEIGFFFVANNAVNMGAIAAPNAQNKVLAVKSPTDKGNIKAEGTLSWAITEVNKIGGLTIVFALPQGNPTVALTKELPAIQKNVTIAGNSSIVAGNADATNPYNIFTVLGGVTAEIDNLTIQGGYVFGSGGGISNAGNLTLKNDTFAGNEALSPGAFQGGGGAIANIVGATLNMSGCTVKNNATDNYGGGILNYGDLTCTNCLIATNGANLSTPIGGIQIGGGIANIGGDATIGRGMAITGNAANLYGGGIYVNGGTVNLTVGAAKAAESIQNNSASANGGGIYVATGTLSIGKNVSISNNTAGFSGGGIAAAGGKVDISSLNGKISDNSAQDNGGGIWLNGAELTLTDGIVSYNKANINGGGIAVSAGTLVVSGGSIQENTAGNSGGGIYNLAGALTLGFTNEETAVNDNLAVNQGGGLYLAKNSGTSFLDSLVSGNSANTGNGVYKQNGATMFIPPGGLTDDDDPGGNPVPGP